MFKTHGGRPHARHVPGHNEQLYVRRATRPPGSGPAAKSQRLRYQNHADARTTVATQAKVRSSPES